MNFQIKLAINNQKRTNKHFYKYILKMIISDTFYTLPTKTINNKYEYHPTQEYWEHR